MITDSHVHTLYFSGDGKMTVEEMLAAASRKGLTSVVITDHYDDDFPHDMEGPMTFNLSDYYSAFRTWKKASRGKISLRLGIELGYQPQLVQKYADLSGQIPFDSIILSNHLFEGKDPYFFRDCYDKEKSDLHNEYVSSLANMAEESDSFDILGHYDYIVRYSPKENPVMRYADCPKAFDRLFRALISKGKSLEINTRTIQKLRKSGVSEIDSFPDIEILDQYRFLGGKRLTLGSDAHEASSVAGLFSETARYLIDLGFRYNFTYIRRKERKSRFEDFLK